MYTKYETTAREEELAKAVVDCAYRVHSSLGPAYPAFQRGMPRFGSEALPLGRMRPVRDALKVARHFSAVTRG
jgi:hypothetical protein